METSLDINQEYSSWPEYDLKGRYKLAFNWIPQGINTFLDAGCAWGYGTRFFRQKSDRVYGLDPTKTFVEVAKQRYPDIVFVESELEKTPFESEFFDAIVSCDTLEHVRDEIACLNEMFRILKPGGALVITTPHKGLFSFMDPGNSIQWVEYFVKKNLSHFYRLAYRIRKGEYPEKIEYVKPIYDHDTTHRHYSLADIREMLNKSNFQDNYIIEETFRSGLFIGVFTMNLDFYLSLFIKNKVKNFIINPFLFLSEIDFWIPYNFIGYNIGVKIIKSSPIKEGD